MFYRKAYTTWKNTKRRICHYGQLNCTSVQAMNKGIFLMQRVCVVCE